MKPTWLVGVIVMMAVLAALTLRGGSRGIPGVAEWHRLEGVFAPTYDVAGEALYFLHRETRGTSIGPGWEHFTPPARIRASRDVFSLRRLDLASGGVEVLDSWPRSPLVDRGISTYRRRFFTNPAVRIRVAGDTVEYRVRIALPRQPTSELYRLAGIWRPGGAQPGEWEEGDIQLSGDDETPSVGVGRSWPRPAPKAFHRRSSPLTRRPRKSGSWSRLRRTRATTQKACPRRGFTSAHVAPTSSGGSI